MKVLKEIFYFAIKYLLLILLFGILIYFTRFYGDFCSNLYFIFFFLPIIGVIILIYIIALYVNDYKKKKFKKTNIVVITLLTIFLGNLLIGYINLKKEVFQKYRPENENDKYELTLYKNQSFEIRKQMHHGACEAVGKYKIIEDTLKLDFKNKNIENLTDSTFTFSYIFDNKTKRYEPLKKGFKSLKINNK
ncbi:hypothetical protein SDC9_01844 [bioreactor metagenome]|jgi:amino acid transporter|uniref:Uncharacterized protein n=1 Tax=bioreactor metagenome TaxID=1076179 RepID=A0A644SNW5_9ZZZZ